MLGVCALVLLAVCVLAAEIVLLGVGVPLLVCVLDVVAAGVLVPVAAGVGDGVALTDGGTSALHRSAPQHVASL